MPVLVADSERCELRPGRNVLGGHGLDAVALTALASLPPAAVITVRPDGTALIQRISAAVIVKIDAGPLGAMPHPLNNGARLSVGPARLTFATSPAAREPSGDKPAESSSDTARAATDVVAAMAVPVAGGRLIELGTGCVYPVPRDGLVIGRGPDCDIPVEGTDVSRRHTFVKPGRGGFLVTDESANGTFVNGARMTAPQTLKHGDVLGIGTEEFRVDIDSVPFGTVLQTQSVREFDLVGAIQDPDPLGLAASRRTAAEPAPVAPPIAPAPTLTPAFPSRPALAQLEVARGPLAGKVFRLERPVCALGRGEHNEIRLAENSVSTSHATLLLKRGTWYVVDLQSANGTYVDGYRVATERALADGGTLRVGDVVMRFRLISAPRESPSATHGGGGIWRKIAKLLQI